MKFVMRLDGLIEVNLLEMRVSTSEGMIGEVLGLGLTVNHRACSCSA